MSITIGGYDISMPVQPYPSQIVFMNQVLMALSHGENALLESPTGTGKTLALLASALTWQQRRAEQGSVHRIFYSARTHGQLKQVAKELGRLSFQGQLSILGSREHMCVESRVRSLKNVSLGCKRLNQSKGCMKKLNKQALLNHPVIGAIDQTWDIEDIVEAGRKVGACPYYAAKELAEQATLIFVPYNYVLDPSIRATMGIDLEGSVVIIDEAHNVEDMARSLYSLEYDDIGLKKCFSKLQQLYETVEELKENTKEFMILLEALIEWIEIHKAKCKSSGDDNRTRSYQCKVPDFVQFLVEKKVQYPFLTRLQKREKEFFEEVEKYTQENGEENILSQKYMRMISYILLIIPLLVKPYQSSVESYGMMVHTKVDQKTPSYNLSLWCLNPAVGFQAFRKCHSLLLASGTLSPLKAFKTELDLPFKHCLEARHVVNLSKQVMFACLTQDGGVRMNASFKQSRVLSYQDKVADVIMRCIQYIPKGVLVFFPSYGLMNLCVERWKSTGAYGRIAKYKACFVEPSKTSSASFEDVLEGYYREVDKGSLLFAVCRGRASEGMDFRNDRCRGVIVVGIPYPNARDTQIMLKKSYNDQRAKRERVLSGSDWYRLQAIRALNQAIGRCIRHAEDYGSIILVEERMMDPNMVAGISRWLRDALVRHDTLSTLEGELGKFFGGGKQKERPDVPLAEIRKNDIRNNYKEPEYVRAMVGYAGKGSLGISSSKRLIPRTSIAAKKAKMTPKGD